MDLAARLKVLRELIGVDTDAALARLAKVKEGTLRIQKDRNSLSKDTAQKIRAALSRRRIVLDYGWLLHGEGEPPTRRFDPSEPDELSIDDNGQEDDAYVAVKELDVRAAMGGGSLVDSEKTIGSWSLPGALIKSQTTAPLSNLTFIQAIGESMAPDFPPGTRVLVDMSDTVPTPPGIFVVWDGMGVVLKRVEFVPHSSPPRIRLSSINPSYSTYERTLDESIIRGRVLGRWAWV
jgi:phage repressor protein C with HTH and peptisase S24 domain